MLAKRLIIRLRGVVHRPLAEGAPLARTALEVAHR
jgi:hypothetical protein